MNPLLGAQRVRPAALRRRLDLWQYAATRRVAGAKGRIDLNAFHGSPAEFRALVGASPPNGAR
jgi:GH25 family lysozyme M1 (1,4-beta-N-acetylmuramidase)